MLTFDHDITAVVGPNGCGKSNTVDAIRWCIGEQSAKTLRGRAMDDVIFAGSEKRPAHSFAEVTITFDNRDGLAPPEFSAYPEIAVTRRLTRDGGSEYSLNKIPVRLMDVVSLFLGTGAGARAYSVVEQGRVGLIVTSKPEDRRSFIEEAAGITRFKARKKAAEKKIELTQQNLLRIGDLLAEIETSLGSLKRQAQRAERYRSLKSELREIELYLASHRLLELLALSRVTTTGLQTAEAQYWGVSAALTMLEIETEATRASLFSSEQQLEEAQRESFEADNEVRRLEAELVRTRDQFAMAVKRQVDAERERHEIARQRELLADERSQLAGSLDALAEQDYEATMRLADAEEALRELRERVSAAEMRLSENRKSLGDAEKILAGSEASRNALSRRMIEFEARRSRLESELALLRRRGAELSQSGSNVGDQLHSLRQRRDQIADQRTVLEQSVAPLRAEREATERRLSEVRQEFQRASARLQALREVAARHEGVGKGVQSALRERADLTRGLLADRMVAPKELTSAVAAVLGDRWQDVAVSSVIDSVALVSWLREENKGRASFVYEDDTASEFAIDPHPRMRGIGPMLIERLRADGEVAPGFEALFSRVVLAETLELAVAARESVRGDYLYVTLSGEVLEPSGRITGGTAEKAGAGLLGTQAELRALEPRVEALESLVQDENANLESVRDRLRQTQAELEALRADFHAQELALLSVERDAKAHEAELAQIALRRAELERDAVEVETALQEMEREDLVFDQSFRSAQSQRDHARDALLTDEQEALAWRGEVERASQQVTDAKVNSARERERATAARNAITRLDKSANELSSRDERLAAELLQLQAVQERAAGLEGSLKLMIETGVSRGRALRDALQLVRAEYDRLREELAELEGRARLARSRREQHAKAQSNWEVRAREEQLALEHLMTTIAEKHAIVLTKVVGEYHMRPPPVAADRERCDEVRLALERIGPVNLGAIEEFNLQEKRRSFFAEHRDDLQRALQQLQQAIEQMNRESRKRFRETFDAVNEHFKQLFPRLFRGGHGELRLSNPEDLLESGVEIIAQPPGKKLVNLESMSGGEKTLTAVTLLFALFMYRPSPFCLLDEVEAALDEANVIRLNDLVRELTDRSQFIMITHNKRTMSMADVLYGVTMEEPGVSKLVGVKLKRDDKTEVEAQPRP